MVNGTIQYLCVFFFSSFWHFLCLILALIAIRGVKYVPRTEG